MNRHESRSKLNELRAKRRKECILSFPAFSLRFHEHSFYDLREKCKKFYAFRMLCLGKTAHKSIVCGCQETENTNDFGG